MTTQLLSGWTHRLVAALGIGLAVLGTSASAAPITSPEAGQTAAGWRYYGCYGCYSKACCAADYLRNCGYCASICSYSGGYRVYYR